MVKVSVIIPVYNVEEYLRRCLNSVCNQTLKDIEIICVNDCSPDNSLEILKEYATKDKRIKIINFEENKGVAIARNTAINLAQGEYLGFVDSDDYVDLDFYEKLYDKAKGENAELVLSNITDPNSSIILKNIKQSPIYFNGLFQMGFYKKELLVNNNIYFIEKCSYGEDRILPLKAALLASKITICETVTYHYENNQNSVTKSSFTAKKLADLTISLEYLFDFINYAEISYADYKILVNTYNLQLMDLSLLISDELMEMYFNLLRLFIKKIKYQDMEPKFIEVFNCKNLLDLKKIAQKIIIKLRIELIRKNLRGCNNG